MKQFLIRDDMVFVNENAAEKHKMFDGNPRTKWVGSQCPSYVDIRFDSFIRLQRMELMPQKGSVCLFTVWVSEDGERFTELFAQTDETPPKKSYAFDCDVRCRSVRVFVQYDSASAYAKIRALSLFGEETDEPAPPVQKKEVAPFSGSEFDRPITKEDTIEALRGLVGRTVGEQYMDCFLFSLEDAGEEFFTLSDENGKVKITANSGVNLACGLGYYYKHYCGVHISQVGCNRQMPSPLPQIGSPLKLTTPFKVRYAYNYCALSYTMAFWGEEEWQRELDLLALEGANVILDITALEEVWHRFLNKLGYTDDEARAFVTGPAYYAWFNMANIYGTGGPVPLDYFAQRTLLARRNHLFMRKLSMQPVLQGYSGMVPVDIKEKVPNASIIMQGLWNGLDRPAMLKTDTAAYADLAKLFYEAQREVFGPVTNYYATDPFHEGGRSGRLDIRKVSRQILQSMLDNDPDAVWIIQSWGENPSRALMEGIADKKEHALVLDLYAEKKPRWENFLGNEFLDTPWVYCMLNNFGGRMGLHGHLRTIATEIARAANKAHCMQGIGITPEATFSNPIIFDLFFETIWTATGKIEPIDLKAWLRGYAERRYGSCPDSMMRALLLLNDTVYNPELNEHGEGAPESVINARPTLHPHSPSSWGNDLVAYDKRDFEQAVRLFIEDIDRFSAYEGYRFDLVDFLKQILSNTAQDYQRNLAYAFEAKDVIAFRKWADKFRRLIACADTVLSLEPTFTLANWVNKAKARAADFDDFSKMLFQFNARALITTWCGSRQGADKGGLRDYSNKQWAGLTKDFYAMRWERWLKDRTDELEGKPVKTPDWFRLENRWTWERNPYFDDPAFLSLKDAAELVLSQFSIDSAR